jgi:hypothetical protein
MSTRKMPERLVLDMAIPSDCPALNVWEIVILIDGEAVSLSSLNLIPPPTIFLPSSHHGPTPRPLAAFLLFPI